MKCTFASNEWEDKRQWRTHTERHFHVHKYNNILNSWIGKTNRKRENCYLVNTHEPIVNNSKQMWILRKKYAHTHWNWQAHEYKRKYTIKRHNWLQVFPIFLCSKHFRLYPTYLLHLHLIHLCDASSGSTIWQTAVMFLVCDFTWLSTSPEGLRLLQRKNLWDDFLFPFFSLSFMLSLTSRWHCRRHERYALLLTVVTVCM